MQDVRGIERTLGKIEGRMDEILRVVERVRVLESWVNWMRGGFAAMGVAWVYLYKAWGW